jgi:hypothetical protein
MSESNDIYTLDQARYLTTEERLAALLRFNSMTKPLVYGRLHEDTGKTSFTHWVRQLRSIDSHKVLRAPLAGEEHVDIDVPIQLPVDGRFQNGDEVVLKIDVLSDNHPQVTKRGKLFAICSVGNPERLKKISLDNIIVKDGEKVLVSESLWNNERNYYEKIHKENIKHLDNELVQAQKEVQNKEKTLNHLKKVITEAEEDNTNLEKHRDAVMGSLQTLEEKKEVLMKAYQNMCSFAHDRAEILLSLDLITPEQLAEISGNEEVVVDSDDYLSWTADLSKDYSRLVSVIHACLLQDGIIYPRWLVGNFLTLLRTNDLIILSGLSGAGKTQIVKSFADILGGVSHIISVKPNWTGAEDLLGFFNPLQKTYVRTPFLDALMAASRDQNRLHLICLDEMNLARAEYYFADFLSALEDRTHPPAIPLYSDSEANHVRAEVRILLASLMDSVGQLGNDSGPATIEQLFQSETFMTKLQSLFGGSTGESFPAFHGRVRRALATVLDIPSSLTVPPNVRFIGTINVDQTTYSLSPKILDRAHVIRFANPLLYPIDEIMAESARHIGDVPRVAPVAVPAKEFLPQRSKYPDYDVEHPAAQWLKQLYQDYLAPLGMDVAYRTIRQAQLYWNLLSDVVETTEQLEAIAKNFIVLQKILPKFTFDGKMKVRISSGVEPKERWEIVRVMEQDLKDIADSAEMSPNMNEELHRIRLTSESSDRIFNYWA